MTASIFNEIKAELREGISNTNHPFKFGVLGTVDAANAPKLRTVVLRNVSNELTFSFYTDERSNKINHIQQNNKVSLLFYHPKKLLQLKIEGTAVIKNEEKSKQKTWAVLHPNAKKDYTTHLAPGSFIDNPNELAYLTSNHFFIAIDIIPETIEYLKIEKPHHTRVLFTKEKDTWKSNFLVP